MNTVDYRDLSRFRVSLGLVLVGLAGLFPWAFLREGFDLHVSVESLGALTPVAQELIHRRQSLLTLYLHVVPWASLILAVAGVALLVVGLLSWRHRQRIADERETLELQKVRHEVSALTPTEIAEKAASEAEGDHEEFSSPVALEHLEPSRSQAIDRYLSVENAVAGLFHRCFEDTHRVHRNKRLGPAYFDVILQSALGGHDYVVEVKYARKGFKYGWVSETALRVVLSASLYTKQTGRYASSIVIFVAPNAVLRNSPIDRYKSQFEAELDSRDVTARLVFVSEEDLVSMDCSELYTLLNIG